MNSKLTKKRTDTGGTNYTLTLHGLTPGSLMALTRALKFYDSPVSADVLSFILYAVENFGDHNLETEIKDSLSEVNDKMTQEAKNLCMLVDLAAH